MQFIRKIGQGGLGVVQLYLNDSDGLHYAVKRMQKAWDADQFNRFVREISLMKNLAHKNIIRLINFDVENSNPYYVMPYYEDGSLRDQLNKTKGQGKSISPQAAASIIYVLAGALSYSHCKGAIHRDIKPENILFNGREPILADWGLGKFIHRESKVFTSSVLGTPMYCPPEQWHDGTADARSDIYSLGLVFKELLTGDLNGTISDLRMKAIVDKMTKPRPNDRYQSMDEVVLEIRKLSLVNETNPMEGFWQGLAAIGLIVTGAFIIGGLLSMLLGDDEE